jgi:hypothetical protein
MFVSFLCIYLTKLQRVRVCFACCVAIKKTGGEKPNPVNSRRYLKHRAFVVPQETADPNDIISVEYLCEWYVATCGLDLYTCHTSSSRIILALIVLLCNLQITNIIAYFVTLPPLAALTFV